MVELKDYLLIQSKANRIKACLRGIRRRFIGGDMGRDETLAELISQEVPLEQSQHLVDGWSCERAAVRKEPGVEKLLKWMGDGVISDEEATARLTRLGYEHTDVVRMLDQAGADGKDRKLKAIEREIKRAEIGELEEAREESRAEEVVRKKRERVKRTVDKENKQEAGRKSKFRNVASLMVQKQMLPIDDALSVLLEAAAEAEKELGISRVEAEALAVDAGTAFARTGKDFEEIYLAMIATEKALAERDAAGPPPAP
jgi:hypothetical protein